MQVCASKCLLRVAIAAWGLLAEERSLFFSTIPLRHCLYLLISEIKIMLLSHQTISRLSFAVICIGCFATTACNSSTQSSSINPNTKLASETVSTSPVDNKTQGNPKEEFTAVLGTRQDGWLPKVLAGKGLKQGLTPAAVGKIIPGAEQVSEYGFSKVAVSNIPTLKQYEFYYAKDSSGKPTQLQAVKLQFDPALNQTYPDLVKVLSNKYGAVKPEDVERQSIVWVGPEFVTAQLTKPVIDFGGYELNVSLEKE